MDRFVVDLKVVNNNEIKFCDIPYGINLNNARFMVSGIAGKVGTDDSFVQVVIPELTNQGIYATVNGSSSIVASTVLGTKASKPTNRVIDKHSIGFKVPPGTNNQSASFTIKLVNESGVEYSNTDIDWVIVSLTFWNPF